MLGNVLQGKRDKVFLASKVSAGADAKRDEIMEALEGSLRRLQTDHVDVYFNHAVNEMARLKNPEWYEFVDAAKRQGKIRFAGMSGHAGHLTDCLDYAIETGRFDVILCAYNFGQDPRFYQRFLGGFDMGRRCARSRGEPGVPTQNASPFRWNRYVVEVFREADQRGERAVGNRRASAGDELAVPDHGLRSTSAADKAPRPRSRHRTSAQPRVRIVDSHE